MPIDYTCPYCTAKFFVDDVYRGKSGPCAECGRTITIPGRASNLKEEQKVEERIAAMQTRTRRAFALRIGVTFGVLLVLVTLGYLISIVAIPEIRKIAARRSNAKAYTNLLQVAKALNAYAAEHGSYPTPIVTDQNGLPLYSWRVLILPQLGYADLYRRFQLDQPWDDQENFQLVQMIPAPYRTDSSGGVMFGGETSVSLVTGPGTLFPPSGPLSPDDVLDLPAQTLLVTEAGRTINTWSSPGDCTLTAATKVGSTANVDIGSSRSEFAIAISVDAKLLAIPNNTSSARVRALVTPQGTELIAPTEFSPKQFGISD